MTALSIYAQAHRLKKDPKPLAVPPKEGAYVATFAERRAVYARAAQLGECDRAMALEHLGFVHPAISVAISRR